MTELSNVAKREVGRWANNRVENSHLGRLQKFAPIRANVHNHFNTERYLVDRQIYKQGRSAAFAEWQIVLA